ncbi:MAG TPA: ATP-binding protein [Sphingobium sp.]|nr:ATP-binding protein [Sphingobium sp.]
MNDPPATPRYGSRLLTGLFLLAVLALPVLLAPLLPGAGLYGWLPLFVALLVARYADSRSGIAAMMIFTVPVVWQGAVWQPIMMLGVFLAILLVRSRKMMAAEVAVLAGLILVLVAGLGWLVTGSGMAWGLVLPLLRAALGAAMAAAMADVVVAHVVPMARAPFVAFKSRRAMARVVRSGANLLLLLFAALLLAEQSDWAGPHGSAMFLLAGMVLFWLYRSVLLHMVKADHDQPHWVLREYGKPALMAPPALSVAEMEGAVGDFVEEHNLFVAIRAERTRLIDAVSDLNRSIGLRLIQDISFDPQSGLLRYTNLRLTEPPERLTMQVHANDCAQFQDVADNSETVIEFRPATGADFESMLLTLGDRRGSYSWGTGVMVALNQPRRLAETLAKQARLVDLGGVASSIGHELKQPLFTIAVAAESLRLLAAKNQIERNRAQIAGRIDRISEQVGRARDIIDHVARYGRVDQAEPFRIDVAEGLRNAHIFLAPMLEDRGIDVTMAMVAGPHCAIISQVELEQVFVNAIQNASDSIDARRAAGWDGTGAIALAVETVDGVICCTVTDNGMGLGASVAESAFHAFFTTKQDGGTGLGLYISRQIVAKAGGAITLRPAEGGGAVLEITLAAAPEEDAGTSGERAG